MAKLYQFKVLVPEVLRLPPSSRDVDKFLKLVPFEQGQWLRGLTKIFLKDREVLVG